MMKILSITILSALLTGCATHKTLPIVTKVDSTTNVTIREVMVQDTIYVEIPAQQMEREVRDSVSFLETDYACSTARINKDGTLYHILANKAQTKPVSHITTTHYRDSLIYVTTKIPYSVERDISLWEWIKNKYSIGLILILLLVVILLSNKRL